ncbi:hypothetical protein EH105704_04_01775 [Atlantibacter hermannii NBRC 105704]|uniref:Uncharacterized protein n=1 Tax=Atlantibacter hermannii NBRC 105704 TaxID=1115512 RepID=H5V1S6_ATLHE|nr:hypothetical protein EH105704_04_01775 [Atlantibacter hermannii NBRC 105704]
MRLEPELPKVFQDCIKQLQQCNHEFKDKDNPIHSAHTRLLWSRSTPLTYLSVACCQQLLLA